MVFALSELELYKIILVYMLKLDNFKIILWCLQPFNCTVLRLYCCVYLVMAMQYLNVFHIMGVYCISVFYNVRSILDYTE